MPDGRYTAVCSSRRQPSSIGFGSTSGESSPAGRMPKRRTGSSRPSRPSSVPPGTCASRRRRMNFVVPSLRPGTSKPALHAPDAVVAEAVAVGVLDDEADAAAALARDHPLDDAVADADHLRARLALDVHVVALLGVGHDARRALAGAHTLERGVAVERAVVAWRRPRTGKRPSARPVSAPTIDVGICGDRLRALEHVGDVPVGVVVGEDRAAQVGLGAGRLQVLRGGEDRVDRVVRVALAVAVRVGPVHLPRRGHELHPALRAGGRDVQVAAVVGLDLVDRGEHLPAHAVLDPGGLVDRQQEDRDPEALDDEVRDTVLRSVGDGQEVGRGGLLGLARGALLGPLLCALLGGAAAARLGLRLPVSGAALGGLLAPDLRARGTALGLRLRARLGLRLRLRLGAGCGSGSGVVSVSGSALRLLARSRARPGGRGPEADSPRPSHPRRPVPDPPAAKSAAASTATISGSRRVLGFMACGARVVGGLEFASERLRGRLKPRGGA